MGFASFGDTDDDGDAIVVMRVVRLLTNRPAIQRLDQPAQLDAPGYTLH